jgi:Zn-dependent M28 family amino/carboxypeptidase
VRQQMIMRRTPLLSTAVAVMAVLAYSMPGSLAAQTSADRIRADIRYLADDAREGRGVGTAGLDSAAAYVAGKFRLAGLIPAGTDGYFQTFEIDPSAPAIAHSGLGGAVVKNVVGLIPGRGTLAGETVVLGAHYDHLGLGGSGSLDPDSVGVVHNGADDNASGTAALIETARLLGARAAEDMRTIVFVAFTAEELGLIGSDHYVKNPVRPNETSYGMINFDMVGRLQANDLIAIGTGSATQLPALLDSINAHHAIELSKSEDPWGRSDHSSFYGAQIPVVHLFTDNHPDYHRTTDDWDKIDHEGAARVAWFAADLAWSFATRRTDLTYVDVPQPVQNVAGGYGAWLGTIPDMSSSPGGVRLNGVRSGSPAEQAGMQAGDILVQIGEHEFTDLYGMTDALRAHKPGDMVKLVVLRDGERVELSTTLGKRGG